VLTHTRFILVACFGTSLIPIGDTEEKPADEKDDKEPQDEGAGTDIDEELEEGGEEESKEADPECCPDPPNTRKSKDPSTFETLSLDLDADAVELFWRLEDTGYVGPGGSDHALSSEPQETREKGQTMSDKTTLKKGAPFVEEGMLDDGKKLQANDAKDEEATKYYGSPVAKSDEKHKMQRDQAKVSKQAVPVAKEKEVGQSEGTKNSAKVSEEAVAKEKELGQSEKTEEDELLVSDDEDQETKGTFQDPSLFLQTTFAIEM
jgi:hypothetical protein